MIVHEIKSVQVEFTKEEILTIAKAHDVIADLLSSMEQARCHEIYCEEYNDNRTFNEANITDVKHFLYWLDNLKEMY